MRTSHALLLLTVFATPLLAQDEGNDHGRGFVVRELARDGGAAAPRPHRCPPFPGVGRSASAEATASSPSFPEPLAPSTAPVNTFSAILTQNGPPDTNGAVGPSHVVTPLNVSFTIQDRSGAHLVDTSLAAFWDFLPAFDPRVLYDRSTDRWFLTSGCGTQPGSSRLLLAVSSTGDPTGAWTRFTIPVGDSTTWGDFPQIGFDGTRFVVTIDLYDSSNSFKGVEILCFDKAKLLGGVDSHTVLSTNWGPLAPSVAFDASSTYYLVSEWSQPWIRIATITGAPGQEVLSPTAQFSAAPTGWYQGEAPFGAPQKGTAATIHLGDSRVRSLVLRNGSLWFAHTVFLPASAPTHAAVQWWEVATNGVVRQFGRIEDATTGRSFAYPSIAVNAGGDVLVGYSSFGPNQWPDASYSTRLGTDASSTIGDEQIYALGLSQYGIGGGTPWPWGDYSSTVVDPANDHDFWTVQQYAGTDNGTSGIGWSHVAPGGATVTPPLITGPSSLANGTVGTAYPTATFTASGTTPIAWSVTAGSLPPGLTLGSSGTYSGTPTTAGTFSFTVTATNSAGSNSKVYTQTIGSGSSFPTITGPSSLANGTVGTAYPTTTFTASGTAPIFWSVTAGSLPPGLTLASSGSYSGTPTTAGTFNFTVTATNSAGSNSKPYSQTIDPGTTASPPLITGPTSLANGTVGTAYPTTTFTASGTTPITWSVTAGSLPPGLTLDSTGTYSGTPTTAGTFSFTVTATNGAGSNSVAYTQTIGTASAVSVIVDDSDVGFSIVSGSWSLHYNAYYYGQGDHAINVPSSGTCQWKPQLASGSYDVYAWWPSRTSPGLATYTIVTSNGSVAVNVDQSISSSWGTWNKLGTFSLNGSTALVQISCAGGQNVAADAVKFVSSGGSTTPVLTRITVSPNPASVTTGGTQQFTASAFDQNGNPMSATFTWAASGGSIDGSGRYTAGSIAGTFSATATSGSVSGSATVNVTASTTPVLSRITVSPNPASVTTGGTQPFTASAFDQNGNAMSVTFTWTATGGSIDSSGRYTAGSTAGTFSVTATSGSVSGSATVNVTSSAPPPSEVIVDDSDAAFTVDSGIWDVHYEPLRYGATNRRIRGGTAGVCRFTPKLSQSGTYDVYAWWPASSDSTAKAVPYTVHGNGVTQTVSMNQTTNWGQWVLVGRYPLAPGSYVNVTAAAGVNAAADAVRCVYVGP